MTKLIITETHVVDCHDLSDYVTELLGEKYDALYARALAYDGAASQNSYEEIDTAQESYLDEDSPTVEQWLAFDRSVVDAMTFQYNFQRDSWLEDNTPTPDPEMMIRYLVDKGHIPGGEYLIKYWW